MNARAASADDPVHLTAAVSVHHGRLGHAAGDAVRAAGHPRFTNQESGSYELVGGTKPLKIMSIWCKKMALTKKNGLALQANR